MEPDSEGQENYDHSAICSESDGSQELCLSESHTESYHDDSASDAEYPPDPQTALNPESCPDSHDGPLRSPDWALMCEQKSLSELSGSQGDASYPDTDDIHPSVSRGSITESVQADTLDSSPSPCSEDLEPREGRISRTRSVSSSSSLGCGDMTLALTLTREKPLGDDALGTLLPRVEAGAKDHRRAEYLGGGGCGEAPPAPVSFGIPAEGAEQAEKCNAEFDTDPCRPERRRARQTRFSHIESESEKHVKDTKSKCKRIALLLTDAPNPQNKGALLFKKRRQRVKKYTLISYGTGENEFEDEDQIEEETQEERSLGYNFVAASDSEQEEEYSVYPQEQTFDLNWESNQEMEALPDTTGKGVMMFAQRRQRIDEITLEHEELRRKGLPVEGITEHEGVEIQNTYHPEEAYRPSSNHATQHYTEASFKHNSQYQENAQQMSPTLKPLVSNRTAKPFLGFQSNRPATFSTSVSAPATKKHELKFKVPVPVHTSPQVWSPTGDIIASRDERISVPAIKTGILPESKRRGTNKQSSMLSERVLQNKAERKSYVEAEEDFFSLGAEACNFMQPRSVKLKHPPPVAPKPAVNPNCPPWMRKSPSSEPFNPPRSPVSPPFPNPAGPRTQHYSQQQEWTQSRQMASASFPMTANAWAPVNSSVPHQLQPNVNSWGQQASQSPVSIKALSSSRNESKNVASSVASCPPQQRSSSKAAAPAPRGQALYSGVSQAADGPTLTGKGAQLFARRQSRMEKFVVDSETVQANKIRSSSPASSLPNSWRYSSIVRAPPPLSYNPILSLFYPPSAAKQPPSTSPQIKPKTKIKPKAPQKHLNSLDVMKHQPYQLDSSLFKYDAAAEAKSPSPKPSPAMVPEVNPVPKSSSVRTYSPYNACDLANQSKPTAPTKSIGLVSSQSPSAQPLSLFKRLDDKPTATSAKHHTTNKQASSTQPTSASSRQSLDADLSAFSPANLIARGAHQMAPRPKFSAKKPMIRSKQWRPVVLQQ